MKLFYKLDLFTHNFNFKYKKESGIKKITAIIISSIIYIGVIFLTSIYLKNWWEGNYFTYEYYKANSHSKNDTNHNISLIDIPPVLVFTFYDEERKLISYTDISEFILFDIFLLNNNSTLKTNFTLKPCLEYEQNPYNIDEISFT